MLDQQIEITMQLQQQSFQNQHTGKVMVQQQLVPMVDDFTQVDMSIKKRDPEKYDIQPIEEKTPFEMKLACVDAELSATSDGTLQEGEKEENVEEWDSFTQIKQKIMR